MLATTIAAPLASGKVTGAEGAAGSLMPLSVFGTLAGIGRPSQLHVEVPTLEAAGGASAVAAEFEPLVPLHMAITLNLADPAPNEVEPSLKETPFNEFCCCSIVHED
jgi:hypothetical protein